MSEYPPYVKCRQCGHPWHENSLTDGICPECMARGAATRAERWARIERAAVAILPTIPDLECSSRFVVAVSEAEALIEEIDRRRAEEDATR